LRHHYFVYNGERINSSVNYSVLIEAYHNEPVLWVSNKFIRRGQKIGMGTAKLRLKGPKPDARITESGGCGSYEGL